MTHSFYIKRRKSSRGLGEVVTVFGRKAFNLNDATCLCDALNKGDDGWSYFVVEGA